MTSTQSTSSSAAASEIYAQLNGGSQAKTATSTIQEGQDRFLKLLVTQLKNQDPLNPLDNAAVTTQLAQINTVTGIEKLNDTLGKLFDVYDTGQSMQAAGMIGRAVLVAGNKMELSGGMAVGGVDLASSAGTVTVKVKDAGGRVVHSQEMGKKDAGSFAFGWDGVTDTGEKATDGHYTFSVEASSNNTPVTVTALQAGTVSAVVRGKTGFTLDLGSAGNVPYSAVKQII